MEYQKIDSIKGYHAHVYFNEASLELAKALCQTAGEQFSVTVGRFHCKPIGPHPCWSCQLSFDRDRYTDLLSWLSLNRKGLTILIHPLTGNDLLDHTDYASWMGKPEPLNLEVLK